MKNLRETLIDLAIEKRKCSRKEAEALVDKFDSFIQQESINEASVKARSVSKNEPPKEDCEHPPEKIRTMALGVRKCTECDQYL